MVDMFLNQHKNHTQANQGKLAAWSKASGPPPEGVREMGSTVWRSDLPVESRGIKVVGTPIGTVEYIQAFGEAKICEEAKLLNCLPELPSLQVAWLLLYFCCVPRVNHLLRTVAPADIRVHELVQLHPQACVQL